MTIDGEGVIRISWDEWRRSRAAKREALAKRGLSKSCRRTTAKPEAIAALNALMALHPMRPTPDGTAIKQL